MVTESSLPMWLKSLLSEKFYESCLIHEDVKKNVFCVDCCVGLCAHCVTPHVSHRLLQIRRYVYSDVIRVSDVDKLMDCSYIQPNITNGAKVVFLNQRELPKSYRQSGNCCIICEKALQHPYVFCSIFCKVKHTLSQGVMLDHLYNYEVIALLDAGLHHGLMTPDSVLDPFVSLQTSSGSSTSYGALTFIDCKTLASAATTEIVRKQRASKPKFRSPAVTVPAPENRRKGVPRRSPFC